MRSLPETKNVNPLVLQTIDFENPKAQPSVTLQKNVT
jgi:hypothetical protein